MSKDGVKWEDIKTNWFCTVSNDEEQRRFLKQAITEYPFWAYIDHKGEKSPEDEHEIKEHTHFMWKASGSFKIKHMAEQLSVPVNMIQPLGYKFREFNSNHRQTAINKGKRGYGRYMIHLDSPSKTQYSIDDIQTNRKNNFRIWFTDNQDKDVFRLYNDIKRFNGGFISLSEFIELHYLEISQMSVYQQIRLINELENKRPPITT